MLGTLVEHADEALAPAGAKARGNLDLIGEFGTVVGPEPRGQCFERGRVLGHFFGKREGQLPRHGSRVRCLPEERGEALRLEEILERGRSSRGQGREPGVLTVIPVPRALSATRAVEGRTR